MANYNICFTITWRDSKGQTRRTRICLDIVNSITGPPDSSDLLAGSINNIITALQAASNAHVQSENNWIGGGTAQSGVTYGTAAEYQSVSQQARLYYLTTNPAGDPSPSATITIPAPKSAIFEADGVTVNPSHADITGLNTALNVGGSTSTEAVAATGSGLLLTSFVGGVLVGKKLSRRFNKYVKDPTLTIAGI